MKKVLLLIFVVFMLNNCSKKEVPKLDNPMIKVPHGTFLMGQIRASSTIIKVNLTHDYYLSQFEITNQEYCDMLNYALTQDKIEVKSFFVKNKEGNQRSLIMLSHIQYIGGEFKVGVGKEYKPMVAVSWYGAAFYCNMRSQMEKLTSLYNLTDWSCNLYSTNGYRLPTEAEWEYAARYDDQRTYPWGDFSPNDKYANFDFKAGSFVTNVGSYPKGKSKLGFFDMAGNAYEWCNDYFADYPGVDSLQDPIGPQNGTVNIVRGGSWNYNASTLVSAYRGFGDSDTFYDFFGFRVCKIQ